MRRTRERIVEAIKADRRAWERGEVTVPQRQSKDTRGRRPLSRPIDEILAEDASGGPESRPSRPTEVQGGGGPDLVWEALRQHDIRSGEGRAAYRRELVRLRSEGVLDDRTTEVLLRAAYDAARDKGQDARHQSVQVRFEVVDSREEARAYWEAQEALSRMQ